MRAQIPYFYMWFSVQVEEKEGDGDCYPMEASARVIKESPGQLEGYSSATEMEKFKTISETPRSAQAPIWERCSTGCWSVEAR